MERSPRDVHYASLSDCGLSEGQFATLSHGLESATWPIAHRMHEEQVVGTAGILRGLPILGDVQLPLTPASPHVRKRAARGGTVFDLLGAGGAITNHGCGAFAGDGGVMADGEVTLSTANPNFQVDRELRQLDLPGKPSSRGGRHRAGRDQRLARVPVRSGGRGPR